MRQKVKPNRFTKLTLSSLLVVALALMTLLGLLIPDRCSVFALEKPGEFGSRSGGTITGKYNGVTAYALNWQGGYTISSVNSNSPANNTILDIAAFRKVAAADENSEFTFTDFTVAEVENFHTSINSAFFHKTAIDVGNWWNEGDRGGRDAFYNPKFSAVSGATGGDNGFRLRLKEAYLKYYKDGLRDGKDYSVNGFSLGMPIEGTKIFSGVFPGQDYWTSKSSAYVGGGGNYRSLLAYNNITDSFWLLHSQGYTKWDAYKTTFGMPCSNLELVSALKDSNLNLGATKLVEGSWVSDEDDTGLTFDAELGLIDTDVVQVFQFATVKADGTIIWSSYDHETRTVSPRKPDTKLSAINGQPSDLGAMTGLITEKTVGTGNNTYYHQFYNYANGAAYVRLKDNDLSQSSQQFFVGIKFVATEGAVTITEGGTADVNDATGYAALTRAQVRAYLTEEIDLTSSVGKAHDTGAINNVNNLLTEGGSALRYTDLQQVYKDYYTNSIKGTGYILGAATRGINSWDGCIVQPFAYGDGTTVIDNNQYATFLIYNVKDNKVFILRDAFGARFSAMGESDKRGMGYIIEDMKDVTLSAPFNFGLNSYSGTVTIQGAQNGTFITDGVKTDWMLGRFWSGERFIKKPSPSVSGYGSQTEIKLVGTTYYINYQRGAVFAESNVLGTGFFYKYYPGRNFDFENDYEIEMLDSSTFISLGNMSIESTDKSVFGTKTDNEIKQMFIDAYDYWMDQGYFIGALESNIKGWNGVVGQQFIRGDSISMAFGDGRPNVAFLAYNPDKDAVYLIADGGLTAFNNAGSGGNAFGAPLENPVYNAQLGISTQLFKNTTGTGNNQFNMFLVYNGRNAYIVNNTVRTTLGISVVTGTPFVETFLEWYAEQSNSATHEKDIAKGYITIGDDDLAGSLGLDIVGIR